MTRLFPALLAGALLAQPIRIDRIRRDVEALAAPALAGRFPLECRIAAEAAESPQDSGAAAR